MKDEGFLRAIAESPADDLHRLVYADWLEERGDPRASFLRTHLRLRSLGPDHPNRPPLEQDLSLHRRGLDRRWLEVVEPERAHLHADPTRHPACDCLRPRSGGGSWRRPRFHLEPQDTECPAWQRLLALVEEAAAEGRAEFAPLQGMAPEERAQVVTLPPTIARLKRVRHLLLYGSDLVRLPPEIGEMTGLEEFTPYTSYRLHWFPYEITRCPSLRRSTVSTRALYGNFKYRPPFPRLGPGADAAGGRALKGEAPAGGAVEVTRPCSVCGRPFLDRQRHRVWVSLRVATDVLPLLVNACSQECVARLPAPPDGYVPRPHRGGPELGQPPPASKSPAACLTCVGTPPMMYGRWVVGPPARRTAPTCRGAAHRTWCRSGTSSDRVVEGTGRWSGTGAPRPQRNRREACGGMYGSQRPWVELCRVLQGYDGADAYSDVLERWPVRNAGECRWLAEFSRRTEGRRGAATDEDLCRLYAASRVTSTLLLRFQSGRADGTDYPGPAVCAEGFRLFHEALGFRVPEAVGFHPFFHEVVGVRQAAAAEEPMATVGQAWPPLMLGGLMFCRAGTVVSGGTAHVVKGVAERSKLYWAYRRKDRPYADESHGWGSNSQWRTRLRRDYRTPAGIHYNIDARASLNGAAGTVDGIPVAAMVELVRNRCLVRAAADDSDLYPYRYSYTESA